VESTKFKELLDAMKNNTLFFHSWRDTANDEMRVSLTIDGIALRTIGDFFDLTDPDAARELAGILVMWANKKQNRILDAEEADAYVRLFGANPNDDENHPINCPRLTWYSRNIKLMTPETMLRNYNDLKAIQEDMSQTNFNSYEMNDIRNCLGLLWDRLSKSSNVDYCNKCHRAFLNDIHDCSKGRG
jgi:hypothetical protein